jgi:hypothetical protein
VDRRNAGGKQAYKISIVNLVKKGSLYKKGLQATAVRQH